jgi:uncharacterized membrane protein
MILLRAYNYFFYKLYRFFETSNYSRWWSEWKAYASMLALSLWLYSAIETCYHYFFNIPVKSSNSPIDLLTAIFLLIVGVSNWMLFEYQDKWKGIVKEFDKLPKQKNKVGSIIVWVIILSIIIFYWFYSIPLLGKLIYK